jgi:uncharacterized membrane protein YhaH (DUF805 family)
MDSYSNRELDRMFSEIQETLQRIESQTMKTNGRVTKLEFWRGVLTGMGTLIVVVIIPLTAAVITLLRK